ncbi:MAG TPA: ABC transporter permease subunit [Luteibaculaceae bacterium]|nr:ABC transporter permease subunit [Luteibaculaceae bacterium]
MYTLFKLELYKIFKRPRTFIAFGALTAFVVVLQLGLKSDGKEFIDFFLGDLSNTFKFEGNLLNGYAVCFFILLSLIIHIPLLVVLISGDMISGEANMGTLRLLLSKPITRTQFVLGKFAATFVYVLCLLIWFAVLALVLSVWIFGTGDILHMKNEYIVQINSGDVLWRYILAFLYAALALTTIAALSFFISLFAENSIGPIVATMCVIIVSTILNTLNIPSFVAVKPYLFTSYLTDWRGFFDIDLNSANEAIKGSLANPSKMITGASILLGHIAAFIGLSIYFLKRKDILT